MTCAGGRRGPKGRVGARTFIISSSSSLVTFWMVPAARVVTSRARARGARAARRGAADATRARAASGAKGRPTETEVGWRAATANIVRASGSGVGVRRKGSRGSRGLCERDGRRSTGVREARLRVSRCLIASVPSGTHKPRIVDFPVRRSGGDRPGCKISCLRSQWLRDRSLRALPGRHEGPSATNASWPTGRSPGIPPHVSPPRRPRCASPPSLAHLSIVE